MNKSIKQSVARRIGFAFLMMLTTASAWATDSPTLTVGNVTSNSASVSWNALDGVTEYTLQLASDNGFASSEKVLLSSDFSNTDGWTLSRTGTYTGAGYYGAGAPAIKFDGTGDYAISPEFDSGTGIKLQFWALGNNGSGSQFAISGLVNGSWQDIETVTIAQGGATYEVVLPDGTSQVRFDFTKSVNCGLDDVVITGTTGSVISSITLSETSYTFTGLDLGTTYYACVKGDGDWSDVVSFTTETHDPSAPVLTVPQDEYAVGVGANISFTVTATGTPAPTVTATCTEGADFTFENNEFVFNPTTVGTYHFVFTATNTEGSDSKTVTIDVSPLFELTVGDVTSNSASVSWNALDGVTEYTLQIASDDKFTENVEGSIIATNTVSGTSYTFFDLTPRTTYYARVKGNNKWSDAKEFRTVTKWEGDGTSESPYEISCTEDLDLLAANVNSGTGDDYAADGYYDKYFVLNKDIEYEHKGPNETGAATESNYTAIGTEVRSFRGYFDGQGHIVSGIRIYKGGNDGDDNSQGLFGSINGAIVKNVILADARITGYHYTGGIVGSIDAGTVNNCHVLSNVAVHAVQNETQVQGGIAGFSNGTISGCTSAASITTSASNCSYFGGIVGYNKAGKTVLDCLYLGNTVEGVGSVGAIAGYNGDGGTVQNCYFTSTAITGKNGNGDDLDNANSAVGENNGGIVTNVGHTHSVTAGPGVIIEPTTLSGDVTQYGTDGITAYSGGGLAYGGQFYYGKECILSLTLSTVGVAPTGYQLTGDYAASAGTLSGSNNSYTLTMPDEDVIISAAHVSPLLGWTSNYTPDGSAEHPYVISTTEGWNLFCDALQDNDTWNHFTGKTVKLGNSIGSAQAPITRMAGSSGCDFSGTFDGDGKTLYVELVSSSNYTAPFYYLKSQSGDATVTIRNLKVDGIISTSHKFTGGIVAGCYGNVNIENCLINVTITSILNGDGTLGGILGVMASEGLLNIDGCAFTGKILTTNGTTNCGGFVGWARKTTNISNCLYAPAAIENDETEVGTDNSITFARNGATITNSYYTRTLGGAQGKAKRTVTAGDNVTIDAIAPVGDATATYSVSGITAYGKGITRTLNETTTFYYGQGDDVSLTLSNTADEAPLGYQQAYAASDGMLSGTGNPYTLTMPASDVTVSATYAPDLATYWHADADHDGSTAEKAYIITTTTGLDLLANQVNSGNTYENMYFKLGADITYSHTTAWDDATSTENNYTAIGGYYNDKNQTFSGHFDGQGHTVSGIRIYKNGNGNNDKCLGIFGDTGGNDGSNGDVKNVILADARITGHWYVGGIVGANAVAISNCHVLSNVNIHTVQNGSEYHGGIAGYNYTNYTITACTSAASITSADGSGCQYFGGIVGYKNGTVSDCLYLGNTLDGNSSVGAIVGFNNDGIVTNCYFTSTAISGKKNNGGTLANADCSVGAFGGNKVTNCGLAPSDNVNTGNFLALLAARTQALTAVERTTPLSTDVALTYKRTFTANKAATICLPFALNSISGGKVYEFAGVEYDDTEGWVAIMNDATPDGNNVSATQANTPYLFMADADGNVTFSNDNCTISTAEAGSTDYGNWTFKGTYSYMKWTSDTSDPEYNADRDAEIGKVYGFAGVQKDGIDVGDFVRVASGARIRPMCCYLLWKGTSASLAPLRGMNRAASELPDRITVRLIGADGGLTGIGELNTQTGEMTFDAQGWYTLDGILLEGQPVESGIFINNGKKVSIIK